MALVMITCPQTGNPVATGIETDEATFQRLPDARTHLHCPLCGQVHTWSKSDATLADGPRGPNVPNKN